MKLFNIKDIKDISKYTYIGRGTIFGNPFVINKDGNRDDVIKKYSEYVLNAPKVLNAINDLDENAKLVCHCVPKPCHGNVICEIKDKLLNKELIIQNSHNIGIVGCRHFHSYELFKKYLEKFLALRKVEINCIISGGAIGVDSMAAKWAMENQVNFQEIAAEWSVYGKKAGYIRNTSIVLQSTMLIAFWDHISNGTFDTIVKAKHFNKEVHVINLKKIK